MRKQVGCLASDRAKAKQPNWRGAFGLCDFLRLRHVKPEKEDLEGGKSIEGSLSEASFRLCYCERVARFLRFLGLSYSEILERKLSFSIVKRAATAQTKQRPILSRRRFNPYDPVFRFTVWALEFGRRFRHGVFSAAA